MPEGAAPCIQERAKHTKTCPGCRRSVSGGGGVLVQDIGKGCLRTSERRVSRHRKVLIRQRPGMSRARLVITAVVLRGAGKPRWPGPTGCPRAGSTSSWPATGPRARPRSCRAPVARRPHPPRLAAGMVELILRLRKQLAEQGLDAGPDTIAWHLAPPSPHHRLPRHRVSGTCRGLGWWCPSRTSAPSRPTSASQPNSPTSAGRPTSPTTGSPHGRPGADARSCPSSTTTPATRLSVTAHPRVTGPIVLAGFRRTCSTYGVPASTLTDNGDGVHHPLLRRPRRPQRVRDRATPPRGGAEELPPQPPHHLRQGRTVPANPEEVAPRPTRPARHDRPSYKRCSTRSSTQYNQHRPHRSLPHRATPATVYTSPTQSHPGDRGRDTHDRVRRDRIDKAGKITLRHHGRLYSIGIGRTHARTRVLILVHDLDIRIVNAATGELLRELILDPTKRYQGTGRPPGPARKRQSPNPQPWVRPSADVLRHHMAVAVGFEPTEGLPPHTLSRRAPSAARTRHRRRGYPSRVA